MSKKRTMKPHPWSKEAEEKIDELCCRTIAAEVVAYKHVLGDLVAMGYTEEQFHAAFDDFMKSSPSAFSIRIFRKFLEVNYSPCDVVIKERSW